MVSIREQLREPYTRRTAVRKCIEELEILYNLQYSLGSFGKAGEKVKASKKSNNAAFAQVVEQIQEKEEKLEELTLEYVDSCIRLGKVVSQLKENLHRDVLRHIFILHNSTVKTGNLLGYSQRHIRRLKDEAIAELEQIFLLKNKTCP